MHLVNIMKELRARCAYTDIDGEEEESPLSHEKQDISSETMTSSADLSQPTSFRNWDEALRSEYQYLESIQLSITTSYMNNSSVAEIKRELENQQVVISEHSVKTAIIRTLLGYKWLPKYKGGGDTMLSFLDEHLLIGIITNELSNMRTLQPADVFSFAELIRNSRYTLARKILSTRNKTLLLKDLQTPDTKFDIWWLRGFLNRYDLNLDTPELVEDLRMKYGTTGTIRRWFEEFEHIGSCFDPINIYNMDEMNIRLHESTGKVICQKHSKWYASKKVTSFKHLTACCCFSAIGDKMPIFLLSNMKKLPPEISKLQEYNKMYFGFSDSGWITRDLFFAWARLFVEFLKRTNQSDGKKILYVDSHNSRENYEALCYLRDNNVVVVTFPPHTTHILQPFDTCIARSFKALLNKHYNSNKCDGTNIARYLLLISIEAAWSCSINYKTASVAFSMSGLYPFSSTNPLNSQYIVQTNQDLEIEDTGLRLRTTSQELTSSEYLHELKNRQLAIGIDSNLKKRCKSLVSYNNQSPSSPLKSEEVSFLKESLSFDPGKFFNAVEQYIKSSDGNLTHVAIPSPLSVCFNCYLCRNEAFRNKDKSVIDWINNNRVIPNEMSAKDKIREALTIAEIVIGKNKIPDFSYEDYLLSRAQRLEEKMYKRWSTIVEQMQQLSGFQINDVNEALFVLALFASGRLEDYKKTNDGLPDDPFEEYGIKAIQNYCNNDSE